MTNSFVGALQSGGPASDRADKMKLYGWLIGQWAMDAVVHRDDGSQHRGPGEIHFGWVLEGRAIQDVWILPGLFYGTTLRVYDPGIDAWHIQWSDPVQQFYSRQIGRAGPASVPATTARPGSCRPTSTRGASHDPSAPLLRSRQDDRPCLNRRPRCR